MNESPLNRRDLLKNIPRLGPGPVQTDKGSMRRRPATNHGDLTAESGQAQGPCRRVRVKKLLFSLLFLAATPTCFGEITFTMQVDPSMDLSQAGRASVNLPYAEPNGYNHTQLPAWVVLPTNASTVEFSSVAGSASIGPIYNPPWPWNGPDGGTDPAGLTTFINSWNGISGVQSNTYLPVMGVFVGPGGTGVTSTLANPGPAPLILDFAAFGTNFTSLAPALNQSFIIGDGRTNQGILQEFFVPKGAAELCIGFLDIYASGSVNKELYPSAYWDNYGSLLVSGSIQTVPEPSTLALVSMGTLGLILYHRRRHAQ